MKNRLSKLKPKVKTTNFFNDMTRFLKYITKPKKNSRVSKILKRLSEEIRRE